jgi:hypothetical protein
LKIEIIDKVDLNYTEMYKIFNDSDEELHRELDKRFDKVYQTSKDKA